MLDVTTEEPLPSESPLWTTPNLFHHPAHLREHPGELEVGGRVLLREPPLYLDGSPERMGNLVDYSAAS